MSSGISFITQVFVLVIVNSPVDRGSSGGGIQRSVGKNIFRVVVYWAQLR